LNQIIGQNYELRRLKVAKKIERDVRDVKTLFFSLITVNYLFFNLNLWNQSYLLIFFSSKIKININKKWIYNLNLINLNEKYIWKN
jgi:hypothetical protein